MTRRTAKFRVHRLPECFPIFQHHRLRILGMCGLIFPSCPSYSSLYLKGPSVTVPLQPIFSIAGAFYSSGFSYCLGYVRANLFPIATTATGVSYPDALTRYRIFLPPGQDLPHHFCFPFSLTCQLMSDSSLSYPNPLLLPSPSLFPP